MKVTIFKNDGTTENFDIEEGFILIFFEEGRAKVTGDIDRKLLLSLLVKPLVEKFAKGI